MENKSTENRRPLRRDEAAEYLFERHGIRRSVGTLAKLAVIGGSPVFRKCGRVPLYLPDDLDAWAESLMSPRVRNTTELRKLLEAANVN